MLDASLGNDVVTSDAREIPAAIEPTPPTPIARPVAARVVAPELPDMSWQTLNALNGLAHVSKAPGQEGSFLSLIVRRSMEHVDGTQIWQPAPHAKPLPKVASAPVSAVISTRNTATTSQSYLISSGDTLALIAIKLYRYALGTDQLLSDNPALRQNPNALRIGQILKYSVK